PQRIGGVSLVQIGHDGDGAEAERGERQKYARGDEHFSLPILTGSLARFILPREAGKGDRASARWKGPGPHGRPQRRRPPPPCFAWAPSPAPFHCAGAEKQHRSRDTSCPSSAYDHAPIDPLPVINEGSGAPRGASNQCRAALLRK